MHDEPVRGEMGHDDNGDNGEETAAPWARDVPVTTPQPEFTWSSAPSEPTDDPTWNAPASSSDQRQDRRSPQTGRTGGGQDGAYSGPPGTSFDRRRLAIGALVVVMLLIVGGIVLTGSGGGDDASTDSAPSSDPSPTDVDDSLPSSDTEPDTAPDEPGTTDSSEDDEQESGAKDAIETETVWLDEVLDMPERLLAVAPFDIVMFTQGRGFAELGVPSGLMASTEMSAYSDGQLIAGATTAVFVSNSGGGAKLFRSGEPVLELDIPENRGEIIAVPGTDRYRGTAYGYEGPQEAQIIEIAADGGIDVRPIEPATARPWSTVLTADGSQLVSESGGVYLGGDGGFDRISTGTLTAFSDTHVLVRECDEVMACDYSVIDTGSGERRIAEIGGSDLYSFGYESANLSPDGRWLRYVAYGMGEPTEVLLDLTTGDQQEFTDIAFNGMSGNVWAPDSSGFVRATLGKGLEFVDVATGEATSFGLELGRVTSFSVRSAASTAATVATTPTTSGVRLIGLSEAGDVVQVDVDSGAVITTPSPGFDDDAPVSVFTDSVGALIVSWKGGSSIRFDAAAGTAVEAEKSEPHGAVLTGPQRNTVWVTAPREEEGSGRTLDLVDAVGRPLGASISVEQPSANRLIGADGRGGVIVRPELGGVYALDAAGTAVRVTAGELLAINGDVAYVRDCDEALVCGDHRVDRTTGERAPLLATLFERVVSVAEVGVPVGSNVSPDGAIAFVNLSDDSSDRAMMIDTITGSRTGVRTIDAGSPLIWTPDSAYAVWLSDGKIVVFERSTRTVRLLATNPLRAIGVVPADVADIPAIDGTPVDGTPVDGTPVIGDQVPVLEAPEDAAAAPG